MHYNYTEIKALEALEKANGDWSVASRLLAEWAHDNQALLLGLTEPYLRGAAAHAVQKTARKTQLDNGKTAAATSATVQNAHTNIPDGLSSPIRSSKDTSRLNNNAWDAIIEQMQANTDIDPAHHERVLRDIAKAFMEKRLEKMSVEKLENVKKSH